jgi:hypothetical protein
MLLLSCSVCDSAKRKQALRSLQLCPSHDLILPMSVKLFYQFFVALGGAYQAFGNFGEW